MGAHVRFRVKRPEVLYESFDDEIVIIDFVSGNYYSLAGSGAEIWHLVDDGADSGQIAEEMAARYDGAAPDIALAVQEFLARLERDGLIVPDERGDHRLRWTPPQRKPGRERPPFEPPNLQRYSDMQELLLLDPIHDVDEAGWPSVKTDDPEAD